MPSGDRTGLLGTEAKSGRDVGYCAGLRLPCCYPAQPPGGRAMGMGRRRRGRISPCGCGPGLRLGPFGGGWPGRRYFGASPENGSSLSPELEAESLKRRSRSLLTELEAINQQLEELQAQEITS